MKLLMRLHTILVYFFLYAPIVVLVAYSFNESKRNAIWTGFTTRWYVSLFQNKEIMTALGKSLEIALFATLLATVIGTMAALALVRYEFRGKALFNAGIYVPMVIPEVVMGVSFLSLFVALHVTISLFTLVLAHAAFCIAYVTVVVRARLIGFNRALEEAAADLGATPWVTFAKVTLPLIFPGILSGALLAFTLSFDDFVITFFNSGAGATTLPIKVYSMLKFGVTPEINAISTIIVVVSFILIAISQRLQR